jgi:predicted secreted acid phosphatase
MTNLSSIPKTPTPPTNSFFAATQIGFFSLAIVSCFPAFAQQPVPTVENEPVNLAVTKHNLIHYHDCGETDCYLPQMQRQIAKATTFLHESVKTAKPGDMLALVLDVDDTALSTWVVEEHDDFGYIPNVSNWCITLHCNPALKATLDLYQEASRLGVTTFFITGRPETQQQDTETNLKAVGYTSYGKLYCRPLAHPASESTAEYKSSQRKAIVDQGYRIVLNVGDQVSDLVGNYTADHSVKLPNPFYFLP